MRRCDSQSGFTLIETLMAVFALALLMSSGGILLTSTFESNRVMEARLERLNKLEIMTAHMRADISATVPRLARSARAGALPSNLFGGEPDRFDVVLSLVRSGWTNIENAEDRGDIMALEYLYTDGQLIRRLYERPDRTRRTGTHETVLADNLVDLDIRFQSNGLASTIWDSTSVGEGSILPNAITFDLEFETGEKLSQTFLVGRSL